MMPDEFKAKAQELYDKCEGYAGEEGHIEMDSLLIDCLDSLGYSEGIEILRHMNGIWYS